MNKFFALFLLFVSSFPFSSCSEKELFAEDLTAYVADIDNGLRKSENTNGLILDITYRPTDLIIDSQFKNRLITQSVLDTLREHYSGYYYFIFSLSTLDNQEVLRPNQFSFGEYSELLQRMSFRMHEYVSLASSVGDSITLSDYMLENTYGLGSANTLLFVFSKHELSKEATWIQVNVNEFGLGAGNLRFRFSIEDLEQCPSIDFSTRIKAMN